MGKDYGGRFYELLSMGLEDVLSTSRGLPELVLVDEDFGHLIFGLLAVL